MSTKTQRVSALVRPPDDGPDQEWIFDLQVVGKTLWLTPRPIVGDGTQERVAVGHIEFSLDELWTAISEAM